MERNGSDLVMLDLSRDQESAVSSESSFSERPHLTTVGKAQGLYTVMSMAMPAAINIF